MNAKYQSIALIEILHMILCKFEKYIKYYYKTKAKEF